MSASNGVSVPRTRTEELPRVGVDGARLVLEPGDRIVIEGELQAMGGGTAAALDLRAVAWFAAGAAAAAVLVSACALVALIVR